MRCLLSSYQSSSGGSYAWCGGWWLWWWYCENPSSRLKRSGWRYSPSLLFTPSLPPASLRPTQESGKSGKENFNNASILFIQRNTIMFFII